MKRNRFLIFILSAFLMAGCGVVVLEPTPTLNPDIEKGRNLFSVNCAACHATVPNTILVGPSLSGIVTRAETRIEGFTALQYIEDSILFPDDYIVEGYTDAMPNTFGKTLTREEIDLLVLYLTSLD